MFTRLVPVEDEITVLVFEPIKQRAIVASFWSNFSNPFLIRRNGKGG